MMNPVPEDKERGTKTVALQADQIYNYRLNQGRSIYYTKGRPTHVSTFKPSIRVQYKEITNREQLVRVVRNHYGFGHFNILFWNSHRKNTKFRTDFHCLQNSCEHKLSGRCTIYDKHKPGWSCIKNPKWNDNWQVRAAVRIKPRVDQLLNLGGIDYSFEWFTERDEMHRMPFWGKQYD